MLQLAVFTSAKKPKIAPSYAWSITEPLGEHYPSTIDTLQYNYQRQTVPVIVAAFDINPHDKRRQQKRAQAADIFKAAVAQFVDKAQRNKTEGQSIKYIQLAA